MAFETLSATIPHLETDAPERQRTVLIWLILAFMGIGVVFAPITFWTAMSAYVSYPVVLLTLAAIGLALQGAGVIALFRLQASAVRIFALLFAVSLVSSVYSVMTVDASDLVIPAGVDSSSFEAMFRGSQIWEFASAFLFYGGTVIYLARLRKREILR